MPSFQTRLREVREGAGIRQAELARRVGIERGALLRYEKGETQPLVGVAVRLSEELGTTANAVWPAPVGPRREDHEEETA
jgi:putative transcriptional regulator